jgi:hypothetical protein
LRTYLTQLVKIQNVGGICRALGWLACAEAASGRRKNSLFLLRKQEALYDTHTIAPLATERTEQAEWTAVAGEIGTPEEYDEVMLAGDHVSLEDWLAIPCP